MVILWARTKSNYWFRKGPASEIKDEKSLQNATNQCRRWWEKAPAPTRKALLKAWQAANPVQKKTINAAPTPEDKTYLEGEVAVEPGDEVELPKSKAFDPQYEKFYHNCAEGKHPHEIWSCDAVLAQEVPPRPEPAKTRTYLEGEVAMEPGDEVELPNSRAFELED